MENEISRVSTQNNDNLKPDYENKSKMLYINDKDSNTDKFDNIQTEEDLFCDSQTLANSNSNIYGNLTKCENIQFGPRIITTNLTVIESKKNSTVSINHTDTDDEDITKKVFSKNKGIYCKIGCTKTKLNAIITSGLILILLLIVATCILLLLYQYDDKNNRSIFNNNTNPDVIISENSSKWLIRYKEWNGEEQSKTCEKYLSTADKIIFWFLCGRCDLYNYCQHELKWDLVYDKKFCKYKDLSYHYAVSEYGLIFEGRSTKCEIPPEFKECNKSVLLVKVFYSNETCYLKCDARKFQKQFSNLNKLIKYNQNNGILSKGVLSISVFGLACPQTYSQELKKALDIVELEYLDHKLLCLVDTCKGFNLFHATVS